jgi:hypothetical protein
MDDSVLLVAPLVHKSLSVSGIVETFYRNRMVNKIHFHSWIRAAMLFIHTVKYFLILFDERINLVYLS